MLLLMVLACVGHTSAQAPAPAPGGGPGPAGAPVPAGPAGPARQSVYERYSQPIEIFSAGLGTFSRPISSGNRDAQAYFNQGFQMMYAFAKPEAVRSFREAWKRDPECAICYWGEAWAWGSYLNAPMTAEEAPHAYAAAQKALSRRSRASEPERALIDAMATRYVERFEASRRAEQDRAYAAAMQKVSARYPDDLDIATLYADALFLLEPRRGYRDVNSASVKQLHAVLEGILSREVRHPGACHLYVHATESTTVPGRAEACAEFLGASIPGASHINHMPSHTWNEVGRWGDSVRANLAAWHSDQKAAIGQGFAIYPEHNLHMLLYAASFDGQGAIAMRAGKDYTKLTGDSFYEVLTLIRFGRFDEVLEVRSRPRGEVQAGLWDFAQGYAHLRQGDRNFAAAYLARVRKAAETSTAVFRFHTAKDLLTIAAGILEGEMLRESGDVDGAIALFEKAALQQEALAYDEPEPLPFSAFHWLGAALVETGRFDEAERAYRRELKDHPKNGWSLFGLRQALAGKGTPSREVDEEFEKSWARSDTWIRASRF
jgi:tetratricopeptide (TPR) repeat protein